ncbi:bifunctional UDP-3-O-[3-hydroxymyristoyl] N-acetylglucosamine deacetylase/3-hydroxyacyl-ACP dehydratase [Marinilongibacter aquaticus]|uniref:bifunctional UDP-3-O-[3-hydroxymyristoyl] N-acetylglucosamine deacetylase/3-hydroxyacyl-ACP dehydratase n=1 Tax=Marinilongibacter aquaticus TaxID=2975157 RepID=UPI0021BD45C7|nr:bifunctional UDP-3-O-[3-hydroxymyristoyl] N-acetylglucosamine deacetylase/3-hydroxyacyl-ACP dehydratase [Marinilongibacter aquaticus]UBM59364.1 bifunctional UDP-3-O-[3-hydroxymyristoyl] N-acetylglucosamine deacetylase/3-hydroxyacyl-ACP dehydratase [Marinilongibacter aquaticus]
MNAKQSTISSEVSLMGVGLHSGAMTKLTLCPAAINHGIVFQRVDLEGSPLVPALVDYVVDTSRGTVLETNGAKVQTTEHLLSAIGALQIDNILIKLDGPEIPIMDGSAYPFVELLEKAGIEEQNALRNYFKITEAVQISNQDQSVELAALPLDDYRLTVMVDYQSKVISSQHAQLHELSLFKEHIAPCRTFVFVHELEALFNAGLIKGGDLSNAVVIAEREESEERVEKLAKMLGKDKITIGQSGIVNDEPLKFKNEPARHKLLDLIGDLVLVGQPLRAHILAARPGHAANVELARKIKKTIAEAAKAAPSYDVNAEPVFDVNYIAKLLPHRYPFQLLDRVVSLDGTTVIGIKNITMNEPQFTGHFPENPVMPGVLTVEAIAQTGGVLVLTSTDDPEAYWPYLVGIDKCRFYRNVLPGDTLVMRCTLLAPIRMGVAKMSGEAWVGDKMACSVEMTARLVKKQ